MVVAKYLGPRVVLLNASRVLVPGETYVLDEKDFATVGYPGHNWVLLDEDVVKGVSDAEVFVNVEEKLAVDDVQEQKPARKSRSEKVGSMVATDDTTVV